MHVARWRNGATVALFAAALAAGCGGSDNGSSDSGSPPSESKSRQDQGQREFDIWAGTVGLFFACAGCLPTGPCAPRYFEHSRPCEARVSAAGSKCHCGTDNE
jgi:hypothetical protein